MKTKSKIILISLVTILFLTPLLIRPKQTGALGVGEILGGGAGAALYCSGLLDNVGGFLGGLFGGLGGPVIVDDNKSNNKDGCLDHLAFVASNILIEDTLRATTKWINGETDGKPKYVQNTGQFLEDVADKAIGEFIYGTDLGFVCSPFQLQIRKSLARARSTNQVAQCSLSKIINNVDSFIGGNFYQGGWEAWGELVVGSNPYIQYAGLENELSASIQGRKDIELAELTWGNGFFSWQTCPGEVYQCRANGQILGDRATEEQCTNPEATQTSDGFSVSPPRGVWECTQKEQTNTPGSVIETQLNKVLASGNDRLIITDEINEVISGLLIKLVGDIFSDKGLFEYNADARPGTQAELEGGDYDLCTRYGVCDPGETPEEICTFYNISQAECIPGTTVKVCQPDSNETGSQRPGGGLRDSGGKNICILVEIPDPNAGKNIRQCSDGIDNDGDGLIDFHSDLGCKNPTDNDETTPEEIPNCSDKIDNDGDGLIDFPNDPGCRGAGDKGEKDDGSDDGSDDDGDDGIISGSVSFIGDNPSPKAPKTLNGIVWLHKNVSAWAETSQLNESGVRVSPNQICLDHSRRGLWPLGSGDSAGAEGNPWVFASIGGTWYAGTYEWLRPGQECKLAGLNVREELGPHVKQSPLQNWKPRKGELVGFMLSTPARGGSETINERSNPIFIDWPF